MSDLALITANKVEIVESFEQMTLKTDEVVSPGKVARLAVATGFFTKGNASSPAEAAIYGIATGGVANVAGMPITAIRKGVLDGFDLSSLDYWAPVYLSTTDGALSDAAVGANEKQTVTIGGTPTGGTFTLTFNSQTTAAIAYNASAATVEAALELLSTIGQGNVQVTGSAGGPYTVEFVGALAGQNVAALTIDITSLTGGTPTGQIATATAGVSGVVVGRVIPGAFTTLGTAFDKLLLVDMPL